MSFLDIEERLGKMVHIAAKKPGHGKHQLYAEIWDWHSHQKISCGWNHAEVSDLSRTYARDEKVEGTCAECAAVLSALYRYKPLAGSTVLVARAKKTRRGGPIVAGLARPCEGCMRLLYDYRVRQVFWTKDHIPGCELFYSHATLWSEP